MKKVDLGQTVTLLANIGVLVGIIIVAYEIRQSNRIATGTTAYELSRNFMGINELYLTNPDVLDLIVELNDENFSPKDEQQRELAEAYARRLLNNWMAIDEAHDSGIVTDDFYYLTGAADVRAMIEKRPGIVSVFDVIASQYDLSNNENLAPLLAAIEERRASAAGVRPVR